MGEGQLLSQGLTCVDASELLKHHESQGDVQLRPAQLHVVSISNKRARQAPTTSSKAIPPPAVMHQALCCMGQYECQQSTQSSQKLASSKSLLYGSSSKTGPRHGMKRRPADLQGFSQAGSTCTGT